MNVEFTKEELRIINTAVSLLWNKTTDSEEERISDTILTKIEHLI
jgi:hypothetical protein